eukprot:INCI16436.9.p1 GENE.INCI16436.9~~INCI16436.9.p1  ORF type:complete len:699 (+),score=139.21 INCI16436.9:119-2215(+)
MRHSALWAVALLLLLFAALVLVLPVSASSPQPVIHLAASSAPSCGAETGALSAPAGAGGAVGVESLLDESQGRLTVSDERVKVNVKDVDVAAFVSQLERIQLHSYDYVSDHFRSNRRFNGTQIGFIAQELKSVVPESVTTVPKIQLRPGAYTDEAAELTDFHVIDADVIYTMNVGVTQELIKENRDLRLVQANLSAQLRDMEARIGDEVAAELVEKRKIAEAEVERVRQEQVLEEVKAAKSFEQEQKMEALRANASLEAIHVQAKLEMENAEFVDNLTRSRLQLEHAAAQERANVEHERARDRNAELVRLQDEAQRRQEDLRVEHELAIETARAEIERDAAVETAKIEAEARIRQERENEDVQTRKLQAQWEADKEKVREAALASLAMVGNGVSDFLRTPSSVVSLVATVAGVAFAVYSIRELMRIVSTEATRRLSQPPLIRESSMGGGGMLTNVLRRMFCCCAGRSSSGNMRKTFDGVVLEPALEARLQFYAASIRNTRANRAPMRHMLFYGPPGTGKTMLAKRLAYHSGMNYAVMSGGDIAPLGADGVTKLHDIFDWANRASEGLILFIDEAEAFVGSRNSQLLSENVRNAISAILFHTGTQQSNFMLVLATNRPGDLDSAVVDRIDEAVEFGLPGEMERRRLVDLYFHDYIIKHRLVARVRTFSTPVEQPILAALVCRTVARVHCCRLCTFHFCA